MMRRKNKKNALILFCRGPAAGKVKTRLAASLGGALAARLYACFLKDAARAALKSGAGVFIFHTPPGGGPGLRRLLGKGFACLPQAGGNLGARMREAFELVFGAGCEKAVVIGSDIPDLGAAEIRRAFAALDGAPAVIGPARDGGYYLLGFRRETFQPGVFKNIGWSGPRVFSDTLARFAEEGRRPARLKGRRDIDTLEDLLSFYRLNRGRRRPLLTTRAVRLNLREILDEN